MLLLQPISISLLLPSLFYHVDFHTLLILSIKMSLQLYYSINQSERKHFFSSLTVLVAAPFPYFANFLISNIKN